MQRPFSLQVPQNIPIHGYPNLTLPLSENALWDFLKYRPDDWFKWDINNPQKPFLATKEELEKRKFEKCELCRFKPDNYPGNSGPKDIIASLDFRKIANSLIFLKSLRTSNCHATVIIFVDNQSLARYQADPIHQKLITDCSANLLHIKWYQTRIKYGDTNLDFLRHFMFFNFLLPRVKLLHRAILCDFFDSIFQRDPFTDELDWNAVGFSLEGYILLNELSWNLRWVKEIATDTNTPFDEEPYKGQQIICAGLVYGGVPELIGFYTLFFHQLGGRNMTEIKWTDQGLLNTFVRTKLVPNNYVPYSFSNYTGPLVSCGLIGSHNPGLSGKREMGATDFKGSPRPSALVHQYNRLFGLNSSIDNICKGDLYTEEAWYRPQ